jgi:hypothetical protein
MKPGCPNGSCSNYNQTNSQAVVKNGKDERGKQRYLCKTCDRTFAAKIQSKKQAHHRKKGQKGVKSMRGRPEMYSEVKAKVSFTLTPTAVQGLDHLSSSLNLSRSELIERIGRAIIPIQSDLPKQ